MSGGRVVSDQAALAREMHDRIVRGIRRVWRSKVEVYLMLSEFKKQRLYRLLQVRGDEGVRGVENCAGRRFLTWEGYLARLGRGGISFGYFAELERLEGRYGREMVRLCGAGLDVVTRRRLLRAWDRTVEEVKGVLGTDFGDGEKIERIVCAAERWQSEYDHAYPTTGTPHRRVSNYRWHVMRWEEKLGQVVYEAVRVPGGFRRGRVFDVLPAVWREVFERHVAIGIELAGGELSPVLTEHHRGLLEGIRAGWGFGGERRVA